MKQHLFTTALALGILATSCRDRSNQTEASQELQDSNREFVESLRDGMTEEGLQVDPEALAKHQQSLESAAAKAGGKMGEALAIVAELQKESNDIALQIDTKTNEFLEVLDFSKLKETQDYQARRDRLDGFATFNKDVVQTFIDRPKIMSQRFDEIDFKGRERRDFEANFASTYQPILVQIKIIRGVDIKVSKIASDMLTLLEAEGDAWEWNATEESPSFESDQASDTYNGYSEQFIALATKQAEAQARVIELMSR